MTRLTLLLTLACSLTLAVPAAAKEVVGAKVCGASDCRQVDDDRALEALSQGGPSTGGPGRARAFYRVEVIVAGEGEERFRFGLHVVPAGGLMRGEDGNWMAMSPQALASFRAATAGLAPKRAARFAALAAPPARVDEVVLPTAAPAAADSGGGVPIWPFLAGALVLLAALGLWLRPRRLFRRDHLGLHDESHHTRPAGT